MKKVLLFLFIALVTLSSCKEEPIEEVVTPDEIIEDTLVELPPEEPDEIEDQIDVPTNLTERSLTTGLPCTPEEKYLRPISVMYNNLRISLPQINISKADIVYECDAEGGITRLMAIFPSTQNLDVIGSIRSARDYFVSLSQSHGAIYVHAGGSETAYDRLDDGIDHIDGVNMNYLPTDIFYRDKDRIKTCGYEHSMMTTGEKLDKAISILRYPTELDDSFNSPLSFNEEFIAPDGDVATAVALKYSTYITTEFIYDAEREKYFKYSYGNAHIDGASGEQLSFENLIVLFVKERVLDEAGRLEIDLTSGGDGYYISGGKYIEVSWSRASNNSPFVITHNGEEIMLNPGKTHISLFNKNYKNNVNITDND